MHLATLIVDFFCFERLFLFDFLSAESKMHCGLVHTDPGVFFATLCQQRVLNTRRTSAMNLSWLETTFDGFES
jgi:hypothetical protein